MTRSFRRYSCVTVVLSAGLVVCAAASAAINGVGAGTATFDAVGPAGMRIEGKTTQVSVAEQTGSLTVTISAGTFDTGIELRNRHMREKYLETGKYPAAIFTVARSAIQFPADGADASGSVAGTLSLHGQTKPVTVNYKAHRTGDTYAVTGTTHVKMTDYGIDVPSYLGVTVKPDVDVSVSFSARDN